MKLFSVFDKKTGIYNQPFSQPTPGAAERVIRNELGNPDSMLSKYPADFELYQVADMNEQTGEVTPAKSFMCNLEQLKGAQS